MKVEIENVNRIFMQQQDDDVIISYCNDKIRIQNGQSIKLQLKNGIVSFQFEQESADYKKGFTAGWNSRDLGWS